MSVIGEAYEILKDLKSLSDKCRDKEIYDKVLELQSKFYEMKEENETLRGKISELENVTELEKDLEILPTGLFIRKSEKESGKNVKYCASCFRKFHQLYPIVRGSLASNYFCSNCKISVRG